MLILGAAAGGVEDGLKVDLVFFKDFMEYCFNALRKKNGVL